MAKTRVAKKGKIQKANSKSKAKPKAKATPRRRAAPRVGTLKGGIFVGGSLKAGRDVVAGDQYNYDQRQIANIASPAEFVAELEKLQAQIAALKQQPALTSAQTQTLEVVEGQVKDVVAEAQQPQPLGARITATLIGAQAVMDTLGKSVTSAVGLGAALAGLGQIALKLFGG